MSAENKRVVALIDMDCFYVQVEEREKPENKGKPGCVVQYKKWKGGGIIAVNYEARAMGVTRQMRGDEAREKCPDCVLYRVPEQRGKADLTKYRDGGKEVIDVMCSFGVCIERASIDEAYIDMTEVINKMQAESTNIAASLDLEELPNTHFVGFESDEGGDKRGVRSWCQALTQEDYNENDWKLTLGAILCEKMRAAVYEKTGFRCSAGLANNKMLAKLACGINKPNKQTVLPMKSVEEFFRTFPLKKVRHLGGKLGLTLQEEFQCITMSDIVKIPERVLQERFDMKTGSWLYRYARGVDNELVNSRTLPKSIGCNKNFTGAAALDNREKIIHWLEELCAEVAERLEKDRETNNRTAKLLTLTVRLDGDIRPSSYTRSLPLSSLYDKERMAKDCFAVMTKENPCKQSNVWEPVVTCLGVSASKFSDQLDTKSRIDRFFRKQSSLLPEIIEKETVTEPDMSDENEDDILGEENVDQDNAEEDFAMNDGILNPSPETQPTIVADVDETSVILQKHGQAVNDAASCEVPKKTGFFATRNIKKALVNEKPLKESIQRSQHCLSNHQCLSIEELFPDLNQVDMETVALLPLNLRRQVLQAIEARKGNDGPDTFVACEKCGKQLLKEEIEEHKDFHLASELQKEFSAQPSTSGSTVVDSKGQTNVKKMSSKRPLKDKKKASLKDSKRSRTIDSFFSNLPP